MELHLYYLNKGIFSGPFLLHSPSTQACWAIADLTISSITSGISSILFTDSRYFHPSQGSFLLAFDSENPPVFAFDYPELLL